MYHRKESRYLRIIKHVLLALSLLSPFMVWGQQEDAQEIIRVWRTRDKASQLRLRLSNNFNDVVALEELAQLYYYDFLDMNGGVRFADADRWEPDEEGRYNFPHGEPAFGGCADSALWYLLHLWSRNPEEYEYLYYPIVQLENFLALEHVSYILPPEDSYTGKFFPDSYFVCFSLEDWEHNYTIDLLLAMKNARNYARNMSSLLADMDEKELYGSKVTIMESVFRVTITGLGICQLFLLESEGDKHVVCYKEGQMNPQPSIDGNYHYSQTKNKRKVLTDDQWKEFVKLLDSAALEDQPHYSTCMDGADAQVYLFEHLRHDGYQAHLTGCPNEALRQLITFLYQFFGMSR